MSLFDAMDAIVRCPRCGTPMIMQSEGPGDFPYLECPNQKCGICLEVRV